MVEANLEIPLRSMPGETEEKYEKPKSISGTRPIFELKTTVRSRKANQHRAALLNIEGDQYDSRMMCQRHKVPNNKGKK